MTEMFHDSSPDEQPDRDKKNFLPPQELAHWEGRVFLIPDPEDSNLYISLKFAHDTDLGGKQL